MMIGDLIFAGFIGIAIGILLGVPWGVAICHTTLEEIEREKERENTERKEECKRGESLRIK